MPKPQKPHTNVAIKMDNNVHKLLVAYCTVSGQTKTTAIERAVKAYIETYEAKEGINVLQEADKEEP